VTLRSTTEVDRDGRGPGWNVLVDLDADATAAALMREPPAEHPPLYGDGQAGGRVVAALAAHLGSGR
jgi:UDP-N-acetylglucosamine 2-epimerase (non-hydrolysing)/UDP-GlcNAc3NAcA epimerase